jgi:hypothetical protein
MPYYYYSQHTLKLYLYINFGENYLWKSAKCCSCIIHFQTYCSVVTAHIHTFMVRSYIAITCWIFLIIFFQNGLYSSVRRSRHVCVIYVWKLYINLMFQGVSDHYVALGWRVLGNVCRNLQRACMPFHMFCTCTVNKFNVLLTMHHDISI